MKLKKTPNQFASNRYLNWNEDTTKAFNQSKKAMASTPVLKLWYYAIEFTVKMDASSTGIGVILTHDGHPLA